MPKHGIRLGIAEIELNVMTRQCLPRRIDNINTLRSKLAAWETKRNTMVAKADWQFKTSDARIKLRSLYPEFTAASIKATVILVHQILTNFTLNLSKFPSATLSSIGVATATLHSSALQTESLSCA